ncbi:MAG: hypothetical protein IKI69_08970 [Oscillospiraceae bacterium]|nr:hypothetical protein [Oscillospiraceae bacterium]
MIERDTIRLLRECDAGVKMGVASIDEVIGSVTSEEMKRQLQHCRSEHETLGRELRGQLDRFGDQGKDPNPLVRGMSWIKTEAMLGMKRSDKVIADLMTDGCNMGVKSLNRYLNQYQAADERSKDMAKRLIQLEDTLCENMREYL